MPLPYNQIPSLCPWDRSIGFSTPLPPNVTKKAGHLVGLYYICIYCTDLSFLTSSPYLQSTFVYAMRGGMELPAFLLLSSNNLYSRVHQQKHILITYKQECGNTKCFELYQYYKFDISYLSVDEHTHVWLSALNKIKCKRTMGTFPSTKEAPTPPTLQIWSSIPLPRPYLYQPLLSPTISIISQKIAIAFIF